MNIPFRFIVIPLVLVGFAIAFLAVERRPGYFANSTYLLGLLLLEVVIACLWRFEIVFFPVTMGCFLLPATSLPGGAEAFTIRWLFLAVGALAGFAIWIRINRLQHFGLFHLIALFCVLSAIASASASSTPGTGSLKAASLFLLFLYAATGGRVALAGRETAFVKGILRACEVLVFLTAACYLVGVHIFGNPNNLGAMIGVVAAPVVIWGLLVAENRGERQRRGIALALCGVLLYVSVCRAAIVADVILAITLTAALRRPKILVRSVFAGALLIELMAVASPSHMAEFVDSMTSRFVYKIGGQTHTGVFGSRQGPWEATISAVKQHPWFGTGFGTSDLGSERLAQQGQSSIYTVEGSNREHGSSYLAIVEYMGMLGILPFIFLLILVARSAVRVLGWIRRSRTASHCAVPFALITIAGLIHAGFEDWLFAAGSYLCVFFWVSAFLLIDLASVGTAGSPARSAQLERSLIQPGLHGPAASV